MISQKRIATVLLLLYAGWAQAGVGTIINDAELRAKPKIDAAPGAQIKAKTPVEILDTQGAWVEIKTTAGERGWLRLMNVRPGEKKHWSETVTASVGSVGAVVRTASTGSTATTGVKGISKEDLAKATPDFAEVKLLDRFQVSAADAQKFASDARIHPQKVGVLLAVDELPKQ